MVRGGLRGERGSVRLGSVDDSIGEKDLEEREGDEFSFESNEVEREKDSRGKRSKPDPNSSTTNRS